MIRPDRTRSVGRRGQVLELLRDVTEPLGIAEIADRLGIHVNTARFHLDTLVDNGQVECRRAETGGPGRPPQLYRAARGMDPMGPRHYQALAEVLATTLAADSDPSRRAVQAGRAWGRRQATADTDTVGGDDQIEPADSVDRLIGLLDRLDFGPEPGADGDTSQIELRNCPFLELAVDSAEVVCPVHLGLMQGAMETWGAPVTIDRLEPFVEPDLCRVHLGVG